MAQIGCRVADYYGCQIVRPRKGDEDVERPMYFEDLVRALGAEPVEFLLKLRCCGGSLVVTHRKAALTMVHQLLLNASTERADVMVTACPLCQVNLECYQGEVNKEFGTELKVPILYFTQLMGLAFGIPAKRLGIGKEFVGLEAILEKHAD